MKWRILIVDDEQETREVLVKALEEHYEILPAADAQEAVKKAGEEHPDLVVLDLNLPDRDGLWVCAQLRQEARTKHIPILILSSRTGLSEKLEAYSVGADDYLEKPFTMPELRAKVEAKMRRLKESKPEEWVRGNITLKPDRLEVECAGKSETLSVLESKLMMYFMQHPDVVLPRAQILEQVWGDVNVSDRTIDTHVVSLRRKLTAADHEIVTIYGAGYALKPRPKT